MPAPIHDPRHKVIAQKLMQLRKDRGLLQIDIAQRLHRPQTFVSKVESGHFGTGPGSFYRCPHITDCP